MDYDKEIYDITKAFKRICNELINSLMRNLKLHIAEETKEGINWTAWQVEQLKALAEYRERNKSKFKDDFSYINQRVDEIINQARVDGNLAQEKLLIDEMKKGRKFNKASEKFTAKFFKINDRKMNALIRATKKDFEKSEVAILRQANDQYRKIIFDAQAYANSGAGTYAKAVDMATKDFLSRGITCIEYNNGARHTMQDYCDMCLKTATKRAYLTGEGEKRAEWGEHLVIMIKRGRGSNNEGSGVCPFCAPWTGKVLIDDVWSGGSKEDGDYPLMSYAISQKLYHPRCKDSHTTYFDDGFDEEYDREKGISREEQAISEYNKEQKIKHAKRQVEKYERLEKYSLDDDNKKMYAARKRQWKNKNDNYSKSKRIIT